MQKRRLLKLADLLDQDAKTKNGIMFDMSTFGFAERGEKLGLSCGTQACAFGLAALSGAFERAGLGFRTDRGGYFTEIKITLNGRHVNNPFRAAEKVFGLSVDQSSYLFGFSNARGARGERAVARRIRDFVKTGEIR